MTALVPPAARQGPGPVPRAAVDRLALGFARRAAGLLTGEHHAAGLADGTELEQVRPYLPGDDVRWLDPAASARTGEPHVRRHVPERSLTTWIVLDVSPSMAWGTAQRLKSDVALGAASVLAELGIRHAGKAGLVLCGGAEPLILPPRAGRAALVAVQRAAAAGAVPDGKGRPDALPDALRRLAAITRSPGLVAIVSDFPADEKQGQTPLRGASAPNAKSGSDPDLALKPPLAALAARHTVLAVEVRDPRELTLPPVRHLALVDPETGEHAEVEVDDGVRARFAARVAEERGAVRTMLRRLRAVHAVVTTEHAWLPKLAGQLR